METRQHGMKILLIKNVWAIAHVRWGPYAIRCRIRLHSCQCHIINWQRVPTIRRTSQIDHGQTDDRDVRKRGFPCRLSKNRCSRSSHTQTPPRPSAPDETRIARPRTDFLASADRDRSRRRCRGAREIIARDPVPLNCTPCRPGRRRRRRRRRRRPFPSPHQN